VHRYDLGLDQSAGRGGDLTDIDDINSATAGFLVHRSAMIEYPYYREALQFSRELVGMLNEAQKGSCRTALFEERHGPANRLHWLVGLRNPNDYKLLLNMIVAAMGSNGSTTDPRRHLGQNIR